MKRIISNLTATAAAGMLLCSCSFLEIEPKIIAPETFYETADDVLYGLAGVYGTINNEAFYGNYYSLMMSNIDDLCYCNRDNLSGQQLYYLNYGSTHAELYSVWTAIYAGIKNANEFMEAIGADSPLDADGRCYTEARFLRAYYHFILAQAWGDVPLRDSATKSPSEVQLAATPQSEILQWCVREMEACADMLPEGLDGAPSRVTRSAVQGILARVYLFMAGATVTGVDKQQMYERAARWAGEVIAGGLHSLNPDYSQVFINMIADTYDRTFYESIWEADFTGNNQESNGRIGDLIGLLCNSTDYANNNCNYAYGFYNGSLKLWDLYWTEDRTDDEDRIANRIIDTRQAWNMAPYNYQNSTGRVQYNYDSKSSLEYPTVAVGQRNASKWRREVVYESRQMSKSGYTRINFPILRYSDVLLMYAEAVTELGGDLTEAYGCVKQVRDRAGIKTRDMADYSSQSAMRQFIRNERGRELCFESLRKYDLIRWGIFVREMRNYSQWTADGRWSKNAKTVLCAETIGSNVQEKHIYQPIPATELGVNKLLRQNPMW